MGLSKNDIGFVSNRTPTKSVYKIKLDKAVYVSGYSPRDLGIEIDRKGAVIMVQFEDSLCRRSEVQISIRSLIVLRENFL